MNDQGQQHVRHREDAKVLAAIGGRLDAQVGPVTVRLPKAPAEAAAAARDRDEPGGVAPETPKQHALREDAAELALIGPAIWQHGRGDGDEVVVKLHVVSAGAAVRASQ
ncbi:hypothetical protein [Kitasatospora sp. DSM 101779]|uniref:hypothetical protein n=1 Tax=Kitasatospora sp. DSM 101779 TaxID=2853165 RepID=UPI0021DB526B|nr:hypothetical protein [Kitasatospora sp. DSM 101779]MCU7820559.1 hypothetical protein [Kitasatospora sp. DSM 101779]